MDVVVSFITGIMVYCSIAICAVGIIYQLYLWWQTPKNNVPLNIFPQEKKNDYLRTFSDVILMPEVYKINKPMWIVALYMHLIAPLVIISHFRFLPGVPAAVFENGIIKLLLGVMSLGLILCVLYLLITKFKLPYRVMCVPGDYLLMGTLLAVVASGAYLHYFANIPVDAYKDYVKSLIQLKPLLGSSILDSGSLGAFSVHIFLVNIVILYFPFSKLFYWFLGSLYTGTLRRG